MCAYGLLRAEADSGKPYAPLQAVGTQQAEFERKARPAGACAVGIRPENNLFPIPYRIISGKFNLF